MRKDMKVETHISITETVWSNAPLHLILDRGDDINGIDIKACCHERHRICARRKACEERTPDNEWAWYRLIGKTYSIKKRRSDAEMEKVKALGKKVLTADFRRCRRVKVQLISEDRP